MHKVKLWVGPCDVDRMADLATRAGLVVTLKGTEHIYLDVEAASYEEARWKAHRATCSFYHHADGKFNGF